MAPIHPNKAYIQYPNKQIRIKKKPIIPNIAPNSFMIYIFANINNAPIDRFELPTH